VCERERERKREGDRKRERACVCVRERERERGREIERERELPQARCRKPDSGLVGEKKNCKTIFHQKEHLMPTAR